MKDKKVFFVILVALVLFSATFFYIYFPDTAMEKVSVENVFIDVNNDGMVDLLLSGEVILNNGTANFPLQPTNSQP